MRVLALFLFACLASSALSQAVLRTIYVTNNVSGTVTAFRVQPHGHLQSIGVYPAGANPQGCALTPDGRNLVVINATSSTTTEEMYTFRVLSDGSLVRSEPPSLIVDAPLSMTITRGGFAVVPSTNATNVTTWSIVNDNTVQASSAPTPTFPIKVAASPDGRHVFLAGGLFGGYYIQSWTVGPTGALTEAQGAAWSSLGSIQGLAVHPSKNILYASTALGQQVMWYAFDPAGNLTYQGQAPANGDSCVEIAIHPKGSWLYVCNVRNDVLTVMPVRPDGSLGPAQFTYPIGVDIRSVTTDGRFVYVTDESPSGGSPVGIVVFRIEADGSLTRLDTHPTGGSRPQYMALWVPKAIAELNGYDVHFGTHTGGSVQALMHSDGQYLSIQQTADRGRADPSAQVTVEGQMPEGIPWTLRLKVEASVSATLPEAISQRVELFDWSAGVWEVVDLRPATGVDQVVEVALENPARFGSPNGAVRVRLGWYELGASRQPWQARIDHVQFLFEL